MNRSFNANVSSVETLQCWSLTQRSYTSKIDFSLPKSALYTSVSLIRKWHMRVPPTVVFQNIENDKYMEKFHSRTHQTTEKVSVSQVVVNFNSNYTSMFVIDNPTSGLFNYMKKQSNYCHIWQKLWDFVFTMSYRKLHRCGLIQFEIYNCLNICSYLLLNQW